MTETESSISGWSRDTDSPELSTSFDSLVTVTETRSEEILEPLAPDNDDPDASAKRHRQLARALKSVQAARRVTSLAAAERVAREKKIPKELVPLSIPKPASPPTARVRMSPRKPKRSGDEMERSRSTLVRADKSLSRLYEGSKALAGDNIHSQRLRQDSALRRKIELARSFSERNKSIQRTMSGTLVEPEKVSDVLENEFAKATPRTNYTGREPAPSNASKAVKAKINRERAKSYSEEVSRTRGRSIDTTSRVQRSQRDEIIDRAIVAQHLEETKQSDISVPHYTVTVKLVRTDEQVAELVERKREREERRKQEHDAMQAKMQKSRMELKSKHREKCSKKAKKKGTWWDQLPIAPEPENGSNVVDAGPDEPRENGSEDDTCSSDYELHDLDDMAKRAVQKSILKAGTPRSRYRRARGEYEMLRNKVEKERQSEESISKMTIVDKHRFFIRNEDDPRDVLAKAEKKMLSLQTHIRHRTECEIPDPLFQNVTVHIVAFGVTMDGVLMEKKSGDAIADTVQAYLDELDDRRSNPDDDTPKLKPLSRLRTVSLSHIVMNPKSPKPRPPSTPKTPKTPKSPQTPKSPSSPLSRQGSGRLFTRRGSPLSMSGPQTARTHRKSVKWDPNASLDSRSVSPSISQGALFRTKSLPSLKV